MEFMPGVHWLRAGYANVYLCVEDKGLTLVDSGTPRQSDKILDYIAGLGRDRSELRHILITHADWDHAGSAADLQASTGAKVVAAPETIEFLTRGRMPKHLPGAVRFLLEPIVGRYKAVRSEALVAAAAGTTLPILGGLQVLPAPGHTPDQHVFYSSSRGVLFAGDALGGRSGKIGLPWSFTTADIEQARQSALRLLELAPAVIACGHGAPVQGHDNDDLLQFQRELARQCVSYMAGLY